VLLKIIILGSNNIQHYLKLPTHIELIQNTIYNILGMMNKVEKSNYPALSSVACPYSAYSKYNIQNYRN